VRLRVIGVGQRYRGDDEIGLIVADRVRALAPPHVEVVTENADAARLLGAFEGADACIAIDSAIGGGAPGAILRLDADQVPASRNAVPSSHGNALAEAIALGHALGELPARIRVVAVVGSNFRLGDAISTAVQSAVPDAVVAVLEEVSAAANHGADGPNPPRRP
jgi:hydrogenase maturation protease